MTATEGQPPTTDQSASDRPETTLEAVLWVMERVQGISKQERNNDQNFNFRGIDTVVNTVGPLLREARLLVTPELVEHTCEQVEYGGKRTLAFHHQVKVRFHCTMATSFTQDDLVIGPIPGEAIDTGDKGTAKAMSVAQRIFWLQSLTIPTDEPDPDSQSYEIAKPEASVSDPGIVATLERKVREADSRAKLERVYKTDIRKAYEDDATITQADADRLTGLIRVKLAELEAPKTRPAQDQSEAAPQQGGQPS